MVSLSKNSVSLTSLDTDFFFCRLPGPVLSDRMKPPKNALVIFFCLTNLLCDVMFYLLSELHSVAPTVPAGYKCLGPRHVLSLEVCESYFYTCVLVLV